MISVGVQTWGTDVAALARYWRAAEEAGYARITYGDGLWGFTHDGWTMLGALARLTRRPRIGPAATYAFDAAAHHPSWLAKRAVTVDHLSGGRLDLRLAVGAEDPATRAFWERHGIAYPAAAERVARLDEAVDAIRRLWAGGPVDFAGRFVRLSGARLDPGPVQSPGPPVWIAAMGRQALGVVARRADGWEASYLPPAALGERVAALAALLRREGRDPRGLRVSVELDVGLAASPAEREIAVRGFCQARGIGPDHPVLEAALIGEAGAVAARIARYADAAATDLMLGFADFPATGMLERFARDVLPALAGAVTTRGGAR